MTRVPAGSRLIDLLGYMAPDIRLRRQLGELPIASPIGLAAGIDAKHIATRALARFGFGFIEVGPVEATPSTGTFGIQLSSHDETLTFPNGLPTTDAETLRHRLAQFDRHIALLLRLRLPAPPNRAADQTWLGSTLKSLAEFVDGISFEFDPTFDELPDGANLTSLMEVVREAGLNGPIFLRTNVGQNEHRLGKVASLIQTAGWTGLIVDAATAAIPSRPVRLGQHNLHTLAATVRSLSSSHADITVLSSGGVHEPADALCLLDAGADAVFIDSGIVFGGPGLAKRTNEAVLATRLRETPLSESAQIATRQSWFWAMLLSIALLGGGLLALIIASTRVVLPYDETLVGMTIDELCGVNDRLLPFLTHDRVTLSGTMLADGILYFGLALWGIRAGFHWARVALLASSIVGFFSFFLFLGFGYFDPFHAFVTAIVFQFVLFTMYAECSRTPDLTCPDLNNDWAWRLGLFGQLVFLLHGAAITIGGLVICSYGVTTVFVQEDLEFMRTTAETLRSANPQLVPMIAHDRASFGGMLVSCGVATFLCALWGFRRGAAWLWWSLLLSGLVAYTATIVVHITVGYTSLRHLLPAFGGLTALIVGSVLTAPWMLVRSPKTSLNVSD